MQNDLAVSESKRKIAIETLLEINRRIIPRLSAKQEEIYRLIASGVEKAGYQVAESETKRV